MQCLWYTKMSGAISLLNEDVQKELCMTAVTIQDIDERLRHLSADKLAVVYDFVSYLLEQEMGQMLTDPDSSARQTMLASEVVLRRDWDTPEEDAAWAHL